MTTTGRSLSAEEMRDMTKMPLFHCILDAIADFTQKNPTNVTSVELTIAAVLGSELARSCDSTVEIEVNSEAYTMFIKSVALGSFLAEQNQTVN